MSWRVPRNVSEEAAAECEQQDNATTTVQPETWIAYDDLERLDMCETMDEHAFHTYFDSSSSFSQTWLAERGHLLPLPSLSGDLDDESLPHLPISSFMYLV